MTYPGEHLFIGQLGHFFVVTSFAFALLSAVAFFLAERNRDETFEKIGAWSFLAHAIMALAMVVTLFAMIFNQYFEYHYVWQHSSTALPFKYIFSCFWEGVEGSFMIWTLWQALLGIVLLRVSRSWRAPVMSIIAIAQVFMVSMNLGVYFLDYKIGSSPFTVLLRQHIDFMQLPLFENSDYTSTLDGRGLNPLLQNYWMVIHPPLVLFGFATALPPFAFAIAGLWRRRFVEWVEPAIPWTFFGVGVLGTGVLMGGAWAYESLSFGGFWAWDPVENSSLVPWLTMVGAAHLMLIQRKKGVSVFSLFLFTLITFSLVQYSSFLTKSGVLGDSSVHSFTDLGMTGQLALSLGFFALLSLVLVAINFRQFPKPENEESLWSREFWMFIGALILFVSAFQIGFSTSFPVINKLFGTNFAQSAERIAYYSRWQTPLATMLALVLAGAQFLKYTRTEPRTFFLNMSISVGISLAITIVFALTMSITNVLYLALLFTSTLAATANLDYWLRILSGKIRPAGSSIAHIGFGLLLLGALISTSQSKVISENSSLYDISVLGEDFNNSENILLSIDDTLIMGDYFVCYRGKKKEGHFVHFEVEYLQPDQNGKLQHAFTLYPYVQLNPLMGNVAEPYTKHYLHKDIYTHVTYAELEEREGKVKEENYQLKLGDTIFNRASIMVFDSLDRNPHQRFEGLTDADLAIGAQFTLYDAETKSHQLEPLFIIRDRMFKVMISDSLPEMGLSISFEGIDPEAQTFQFNVREKAPKFKDFVVMKAIVFPGINILWTGCIIMALGTFLSVIIRIRKR